MVGKEKRVGSGENAGGVSGPQMALWQAAVDGDAARLRQALAAGADANAKDPGGETAAHRAAKFGSVECLAALMEAGADMCLADNNGRAPLHWAAKKGNAECVKLLAGRSGLLGARRVEADLEGLLPKGEGCGAKRPGI